MRKFDYENEKYIYYTDVDVVSGNAREDFTFSAGCSYLSVKIN